MVQTDEAGAAPARKRKWPVVLAVLLVMLAIAILMNWSSIVDIASGEKTFRTVLTGKAQHADEGPTFSFPSASGPEGAGVEVYVVAREGYSCHESLVALWAAIGSLQNEQVRIEFHEIADTPLRPDGSPHELGCDCGVVINDETEFVLGDGETSRTLFLTGPMPMGLGIPDDAPVPENMAGGHGGWTIGDLAAILNRCIEDECGTAGTYSAAEIERAMASPSQLPPPRDGQLPPTPEL